MQQRQQQLHRMRRLHSVLGPGGALMSDELYQMKFGNVTESKPFGMNVYKGMVAEFENEYSAGSAGAVSLTDTGASTVYSEWDLSGPCR